METPSSMRRITRSQTSAASKNIHMPRSKKDESETLVSRSRKGKTDRSALVDITNDSPIVGVAMETLDTPSAAKDFSRYKQTPGSGEALLRGQVRTLLQKIEEDAELSKLPFQQRPFPCFLAVSGSPSLGFLAPTPANTPLVENISDVRTIDSKEDSKGTQVIYDEMKQEQEEANVSRALMFDSPGKSEISVSSALSSVITSETGSVSVDEDNSSPWSIQVNASSNGDGCSEEEDDDDCVVGELDELCEDLSRICMEEKELPQFTGRHTRFIYNSDDEIEGEEAVRPTVSPSILRLKGIPTPEGKHLRFNEEEEGEE